MTDPIDFGRGLQLSLTLLQWDGDDLARETAEARTCLARMDWSALSDARIRRVWAVAQAEVEKQREEREQ